MCQLFSASAHTKVPPLAVCFFRPRASLRGAESFFWAALEFHPSVSLLREGNLDLFSLTDPVSPWSPLSSDEDAKWWAGSGEVVRLGPEQVQALLHRNWSTGEIDRSWTWRGGFLGEVFWLKTSFMVIATQRSAARHMHEKQDKIKSFLVSY